MPGRVDLLANASGQIAEEVGIFNRVHRIQTQAVEAVFEQPHQRVFDEELTHFRTAEIDRGAPGRVLVLAEKAFGVTMQIVAVGTEVVVDDVENHRQAMAVGGVDQVFELFRCAVGGLRCIGQHPVVAPVAITGKLRQRHQFDGGNAQRHQARQMLFNFGKSTERTDVQLVNHRFAPRPTIPGRVPPLIGMGVDHHAVAVEVTILRSGGRVRHLQFAIDAVTVATARRAIGLDYKPTVALRQHGQRFSIFQFHTDVERVRRPQRKLRVLGIQHDRAVGPGFLGP